MKDLKKRTMSTPLYKGPNWKQGAFIINETGATSLNY